MNFLRFQHIFVIKIKSKSDNQMRVSSFVLLAVLVMLSILPTFEAGSSFFVEAKAGTSSHTKHENMGTAKKKEDSTDT